jgi:biopolymer transport protein ExbD
MAGGGSARTSGGKKKARIEIIPLIDVIFFLLATFILFTLSLNKSNGLPLTTYPTSSTGEPRDPAGTATVTVLADGTPAWDKEPVNLNELINRLQQFHLEHPDPDAHILINGDAEASFNQVIYVVDQARRAGIQKVLIETLSKSAKAENGS